MYLPDLPKGKNRSEAKIDSKVAKWFFNNYPSPTLIEVKMKGGKLKEHQERLLNKVTKEHSFMYKFPDGGRRTPLDYVVIPKGLHAVLAICDGNKCMCFINGGKKIIKINV